VTGFRRGLGALAARAESSQGGPGWVPRGTAMRDEMGSVWANVGVHAECGKLRSILLRRPGREIVRVDDPAAALWFSAIDPIEARAQHDAMAEAYRARGVSVYYVEEVPETFPNMYFCRDHFAMTPLGAILARPASRARAGEERYAAQALAALGVPILASVSGEGTFEGPDLIILSDEAALIGVGTRTNRAGAAQVRRVLDDQEFASVTTVDLPYATGHFDGMLSILDRDLAMVFPTQLPFAAYLALRDLGFRIIDIPDEAEAQGGMAINLVPLEPGTVLMPAGNPRTADFLRECGVTVIEAEVSELMKGGGSIHCMTGVLARDPL
jgi:arginine deiminase